MPYTIEFEELVNYSYDAYGVKRPLLAVRLDSANGGIDTSATLDTGATFSIFKAEYLFSLGLNLLDGVPEEVTSIITPFRVYKHEIKLRIFDKYDLHLAIGFNDSIKRNLLGRDFFNSVHFGIRENSMQTFFKLEP